MFKDYYIILGIPKEATDDDIKKAYRKQALKHHPDKNKSTLAEDRFKEIAEAYEMLKDKEQRDIFDQYVEERLRGVRAGTDGVQPHPFEFHSDPRATFTQFFGSNMHPSPKRKKRQQVKISTRNTVIASHVNVGPFPKKVNIANGRLKLFTE